MGADTAVFAYFHLLPDKKLMVPIFAAPLPPFEATLTPIRLSGDARLMFQLVLKLSPARAEAALARIRATFDATDKRVADGRLFLTGDRLTLGDLALASASAPLLPPQGYGAKMPPIAQMPTACAPSWKNCARPGPRPSFSGSTARPWGRPGARAKRRARGVCA